MKTKFFAIFALTLLSFCIFNSIEAIGRGGGRGGGGARGGAGSRGAGARSAGIQGRGAQGAYRAQQFSSPSMSRSDFGSRQTFQTGAFSNPAATRSQLQQHLQTNQGLNRTALNQNLGGSLPQLNQANARTAAQVTQQFRQQNPNAGNLLNNRLNANRLIDNAYLWRNAGWASTAAWMGLGTYDNAYPAYYYDASGIPSTLTPQQAVTYAPQNVIVMPQQAASTNQPPTSSTSAVTPNGEWLPLGVFAVGSTAEEAPYSNMVMQLSLSKEGYLSGTYYNAATDKSYSMEGMVDKKSQEAIWKTSDNPDSPVAWTGLYNLTQDVADIQVRFPNGVDQTKVLVRLKN